MVPQHFYIQVEFGNVHFRNLFNRFIFVIAYIFGVNVGTHFLFFGQWTLLSIILFALTKKKMPFFFTFDFFKFADLILILYI